MHRPLVCLAAALSLAPACSGSSASGGGDGTGSSAQDADGDGFLEFEDCDDSNASVNDDAPEICDGIDNNCDGKIDDADPALDLSTADTWPVDADEDGFGSATETLAGCEQPAGTVDNADDCNDDASAIYPSAPEACGDAIDQDCDGADLRCAPTGVLTVTAAPLQLQGEADTDFGSSLAAGDLNGDGQPDLIVGAPTTNNGSAIRAGAMGVFFGPLSGVLSAPGDADLWLPGQSTEDNFGFAMAVSDDVLVATAPRGGPSDAGVAYIAALADGLPTALSELPTLVGNPDSAAGHTVTLADLDANGTTDAALGAIGDVVGGFAAGAVWLVPDLATHTGGDLSAVATAQLLGAEQDSAGWSLDAADLNGDGFPDLAIGAPGRRDRGAVFVVDGPVTASALLDDVGLLIEGGDAGFRLGESLVAGGDLTGDGLDDLIVGDPSDSGTNGAAWLLASPLPPGTTLDDAQATWSGRADDSLGFRVEVVGDVDQDGWLEVAVSGSKTDQAWLYYGPVSGAQSPSTSGARLTGSPGESIGAAAVGLGDVDNDGYDDVLWSDNTSSFLFGYYGGRR